MNGNIEQQTKSQELILDGIKQKVQFISSEPTEPGFGYHVDVYSFVDPALAESQDLALTVIEAGKSTPPQYVKRDGEITDYPLGGSGTFVCIRPDGTTEVTVFEEGSKETKVRYGKGCFIFWVAGEHGFKLAEVCSPPYKLGDLENLKMDGSDSVPIPESFTEHYKKLTA